MLKLPIYLDNHSTTPVDPRVLEAMLPYFNEKFGNAASRNHAFDWEAEAAVDQARANIAGLIRASAREIVFTSGATESNNLAIKGAAEAYRERGDHIVTCATEHRAVLDSCKAMERRGFFTVTYLPVDRGGRRALRRLEGTESEPQADHRRRRPRARAAVRHAERSGDRRLRQSVRDRARRDGARRRAAYVFAGTAQGGFAPPARGGLRERRAGAFAGQHEFELRLHRGRVAHDGAQRHCALDRLGVHDGEPGALACATRARPARGSDSRIDPVRSRTLQHRGGDRLYGRSGRRGSDAAAQAFAAVRGGAQSSGGRHRDGLIDIDLEELWLGSA